MALSLATFQFDVTPPLGHSLCGGWIPPATVIDDPLSALGFVLMGTGRPIVICAIDWTGLCNEAHWQWRSALAEGAGTSADRVAVHCVHQHDAPFVCLEADRIVRAEGDLPPNSDPDFFRQCLARAKSSVRRAVATARPVTHVAASRAQVQNVTSNRRILGDDGQVRTNRSVAPGSDDVRSLPAGVIDPWLKTVAFYDGRTKIAAAYYYAVHPISYCCQEGRVNAEFVGHARQLKQQHDDPHCTHIYLTGCAGNQNTGKYNNSDVKSNRQKLAQRMYEAMEAASQQLRPEPVQAAAWTTYDFLPPPRLTFSTREIQQQISDRSRQVVLRNRPAFMLSWLRRCERKIPVTLSGLHVNDITLIHLPGEPFVEYQLRAQALAPQRFVAVAGYGDGGPWYIPTAEAYRQGGYEVNVAFCEPVVDLMMMTGMQKLLDQTTAP